MTSIELVSVKKKFNDREVLKSISMKIEPGEMVSLLGPSGCGKTTTLKVISGLLETDEGDITFNGKSVKDVRTEKREAVIVFQDNLLFPHMTVEKNIEFGLKMAKKDKTYRKAKVTEMIELVKLKGQEKKYPDQLSGGQKQRVAIARALAVEPKVLLLDEPFSNLDLQLKKEIRELVVKIQKSLKITTVLVTHDKEDAMMTSERIAIMMEGSIVQVGTPNELYAHPNSVEVADFFGEANYLKGIVSNGVLDTELGPFSVGNTEKRQVTAMFRPEDLRIFKSEDCSLKGEIVDKKYLGNKIYYRVKSDSTEFKSIMEKDALFEIGESVCLKLTEENMIFYEW